MGGVAKRRFGDQTAPANPCLIPGGFTRTALLSGEPEGINQRRNRIPLGDFRPELAPHFQRRDSQVDIDLRVLVTGQEKADGIVPLVLQYEIGERHWHCKNTHYSLYLYDREKH